MLLIMELACLQSTPSDRKRKLPISCRHLDFPHHASFGTILLKFSERVISPSLPLCGHSILIDEIAIEERPVFVKWLNTVGGLCREHTKFVDLRMTNIPGLRILVNALFQPTPTIHFAKEATVAGIAAFRAEHYEVKPVFAAGTCKTEKAPDCVKLIQALLDAWKDSPDGEKRHGPIWSVASDGDGVRRATFHTLFMKDPLKPEDLLFAILSPLVGLNLQTGESFITAEFDPKHPCKRLCLFYSDFTLYLTFYDQVYQLCYAIWSELP